MFCPQGITDIVHHMHPGDSAAEDSTASPSGSPLSDEDIILWLGQARYERYLRVAHTKELALALYSWNANVAALALTEVWHLEVAIRNIYHRLLSNEFGNWTTSESRLWRIRVGPRQRQEAQSEQNRKSLDSLAQARIGSRGNPDQIIAHTSLGFWCSLTDPHREPILWTGRLQFAYPPGTARGPVHRLAQSVLTFRNRLSHNEPVFSTSIYLADNIRQVRTLHALLLPATSNWTARQTNLTQLVEQCPIRGIIQWPTLLRRG